MVIKFNTDNAAFCDANGEPNDLTKRLGIIDIICDIKYKVSQGWSGGPIMDINGNKIGEWSL
jgi:hypothetical protein